jgi:DnaJ-class molecular chaperone
VIKAAYKALAVEHHPDHGGSHDRMKAINVAYDLITKWKNSQRASA